MPKMIFSDENISRIKLQIDKDKVVFTDPKFPKLQLLLRWQKGAVRSRSPDMNDFNRTWFFRYQVPDSDSRAQLKIGDWPDLSPKQAFDEIRKHIEALELGIDPKPLVYKRRFELEEAKLPQTRRNTLKKFRISTVLEQMCDEWTMTGNSPDTIYGYRRALELYVLPEHGDRDIRSITGQEWDDIILRLANVEHKPGAASNLHKAGRRLLSYAVDKDIIRANPLLGRKNSLKATRLAPVEHYLGPEEVHQFLNELPEQDIDQWAKVQLELMLRVGVRIEEWDRVRIGWINFTNMRIEHPAESMKGRKKAWTHLPECVVKLLIDWLKHLKAQFGDLNPEWYLFGKKSGPALPRPFQLADETRKIDGWVKFTPKDMRKTLSTHLQRQGCPPAVLRTIRNQSVTEGVEAHYDFDDLYHLKKLWVEKWNVLLEEAKKSSKVLMTERDVVLSSDLATEVKGLFG